METKRSNPARMCITPIKSCSAVKMAMPMLLPFTVIGCLLTLMHPPQIFARWNETLRIDITLSIIMADAQTFLSLSHFFLHNQMKGKIIERSTNAIIIMMLVFPNWEIPKNVATVFGKEVTVVTIVK